MANKRLGRGLSSLIGESNITPLKAASNTIKPDSFYQEVKGNSQELPIDKIQPGKFQPRSYFNEEDLAELAESIRKNGVVQPIVVRPIEGGAKPYEIIAGERRWRASSIIGKTNIPVVIMELSDRQALEIAIVENVQRKNLKPLEIAAGYQRLINEFSYTQEELSEVIGKSRTQITNTLRLLELPDDVKSLVDGDLITVGHARALLVARDPASIAEQIIKRGLSVRQTEKMVQSQSEFPRKRKSAAKDPDIAELESTLSRKLGLEISISNQGQSGKITISYQNLAQLDLILRKLEGVA